MRNLVGLGEIRRLGGSEQRAQSTSEYGASGPTARESSIVNWNKLEGAIGTFRPNAPSRSWPLPVIFFGNEITATACVCKVQCIRRKGLGNNKE